MTACQKTIKAAEETDPDKQLSWEDLETSVYAIFFDLDQIKDYRELKWILKPLFEQVKIIELRQERQKMTLLQIIGKLRKEIGFYFIYNFIDKTEVMQIKQKQKA